MLVYVPNEVVSVLEAVEDTGEDLGLDYTLSKIHTVLGDLIITGFRNKKIEKKNASSRKEEKKKSKPP